MDTLLLKKSFRAVALTAMQAAQIAPMVHATCHAHPETERPSLPHPHPPHSIPPTHTHTHTHMCPSCFSAPGQGPSLQVELCSLLPVKRLREQVSMPAWLIPRKGRAGERRLPSICTTKTRMVIKNNQSGRVILKQKKDTGLKLKKSIPRVRQVGLSEQQLPEQEDAHLCVHLGHGCSPVCGPPGAASAGRAGTPAQAGCGWPSILKSTYRVIFSSLCPVWFALLLTALIYFIFDAPF